MVKRCMWWQFIFAKQIVYYDDEPGEIGDLLYTTRYPLSKAKLKFVAEGEEDGEFCAQ